MKNIQPALKGRNHQHRAAPYGFGRPMMMLLLLLCSSALHAQKDYAIGNIPPHLLTNAQAVVRFDETTFKVTEADEAEIISVFAITILNKEADHFAQKAEGESAFEKIKYLEGRVFDAAGEEVRESKKSDIQDYGSIADYEYSDSHIKALDMRYGQYPYTVEFKTKQIIKGFFRIPTFGIEHLGRSVQHAAFRLIAPNDYDFRWKGVNTDVQPKKTADGNRTEWLWAFENLPAKPKETYHPYFGETYSQLVVAPSKVKIEQYSGNFENWNQIGRFFYDMNKSRDQISPNMQTYVTALTKELPTNRAKIEVLYRYLQENYRYISIQIGIGGWQTFDAQSVEQKKYGDCKALSNYMKALLSAAGIPAYHVLVFAGSGGGVELYEDAPAPIFNHMILYVPGEDLWLECTSNDHPTGYLGDFTADRQVLLLTPDGGKLVRTPAMTSADNTESHRATITLSAEGNAQIINRMHTSCDRHDRYRAWTTQKKQAELEKLLAQDLGFSITKINALDIRPHKALPEAIVQYEVSAPAYATRSGKRMFVPLLKIHPFRRTLPADQARVLDLKIQTVYTFRDTVTIQFPIGFTIENIPPGKKIDSEFGRYDLQVEKAADRITVVRVLEIKRVSVPAARYNEVRQFYLEVIKMDGAQAVLVNN